MTFGWLFLLCAGEGRAAPDVLLIPAPPTTLHPLYAWTREDHYLHELVHERLFEPDGRGSVRSDVLESFKVDGSVVEVVLAKRKWHDGARFVAADVCATIDRIKAADRPTSLTATASGAIASCLAGDDERTVRITMSNTPVDLLRSLSLPLVPAHDTAWTGAGPQSQLAPVGLGRYRIERLEDGFLLRRHDKERANYRKLLVEVAAAPGATLSIGEGIGAPFLAPDELATVRNVEGISLDVEPADSVWALVLNTSRGPLRDPNVRGALDRLLDREALAEAWFGRDGDLATQPYTPVAGPFPPRSSRGSTSVLPRDEDAARAAMTEAGLVEQEGLWSAEGNPLTLKVAVPLGNCPDPQIIERTLSEQLSIRVEVAPLTQVQWWLSLLAGGHVDVTDAALIPIPASDPGSVLHTRTEARGLNNPFSFSDPTVDALLDGQLDDGAAFSLNGRLADTHPALFLFAVDGRSAWRGERP